MTYLKKALRWAYGDSLRYIGFMLAVAFCAEFGIVFLSYPMQTLFSLVALFVIYVLFVYFNEL